MILIQYFSLGLLAINFVLVIWVAIIAKGKFLEYFPFATWFLHGIVFYAFVLLDVTPFPDEYTAWSSSLRAHGFLVMAYFLSYKVWYYGHK